jgi:DNA polymerase-3 subunit chi
VRSGARVAVFGPAGVLERLDRALWTFEALEFIPHVMLPRDAQDAAKVARTPVVLCAAGAVPDDCAIAVVLDGDHPITAAGFARVIEVIGEGPDSRQAGRQRWRDYERQGITPNHVNAASRG